jgi:hypothetical protein
MAERRLRVWAPGHATARARGSRPVGPGWADAPREITWFEAVSNGFAPDEIRLALDLVVEVGDALALHHLRLPELHRSPLQPGEVRNPLADQVRDEANPDRVEDPGVQALPGDARAGDPDDPVPRVLARPA